jgi:SNF2 family DNA or RNA helicase
MTVTRPTVDRRDNRIWLWTPRIPFGDDDAFERQKQSCKRVQGARWRATEKVWSYPLEWGTCLELRHVWGDQLVVGPELTAWAKTERERRAGLRAITKLDSFHLDRVTALAPLLAKAMTARTYQQVGAAFLSRSRSALLADDPGLGKTLQALAAVLESLVVGPTLIVAPAPAVTMTWLPEIEKWLPGDLVRAAVGSRTKRERAIVDVLTSDAERRWLVINPEMLRPGQYPVLTDTVWAHVIVDESHKMLITRTAMKKDQPLQRQGLGALRIRDDGLRLAMSGTPFRGHLENLWGTLNWLNPTRYTSFWRWVERWFEVWDDPVRGNRVIGDLHLHLRDQFYAELDSVMLRRTKAEAAPDLPPKLYAGRMLKDQVYGPAGIWLPMLPAQKKAYEEMRRHAAAELEGGTLLANGVLAEYTRLKQFATSAGTITDDDTFVPALPSNKFEWLVNWLAERGIEKGGEGTSKVIVASQYSQVIDLFHTELAALGIDSLRITGSVVDQDRVDAKNQFQAEGGPRVMLLTTTAGGVSLTLDAADDVIFVDETWIPDDQTQVEDRAHRVSRMHQVTIWYLRSLGSIEHKIATSAFMLDAAQKDVLDGRRGIDIARQLLAPAKGDQ